MQEYQEWTDELGPSKIIHIHEPGLGLKGTLVIDNIAIGTSIGGLRMALDVSTTECFRLARAMTLKNAAAGLPHGGGKSVIYADPKIPKERKEPLIRAMASALRETRDYIFGPDMGTNETCMAWIRDEIGRAVGLPRELGGIPLDEVGATGWGVTQAAEIAQNYCNLKLQGARVVLQGFGAVGKHAARFLAARGAILVAASDSGGTLHDPEGIDVEKLIQLKNSGKSVTDYAAGRKSNRDAIIDIDCDIWIPAARPDVIRDDNVHRLKAKLVIEGANIPITLSAEKILHEKGVICVPDFVANAGGVICAAMEYQGASQAAAFSAIEEKI